VPIVAPPDQATVVFLRHESSAKQVGTTVFDDGGRFLGDTRADSYFAVNQSPGEHVYYTWRSLEAKWFGDPGKSWGFPTTAALRATLAPGRVYYVEIALSGFATVRIDLLAVTPRNPKWPEVQTWLTTTTMMRVDARGGQLGMLSRGQGKDLPEELRLGRETLAHYSATDLEARTLRPDDGVITTAPSTVAPAEAPPPPPATPTPPPPAPQAPTPPAPTSKRPSPLPPPGTPAGCKPPTWTDDDGRVHIKPGCQ
jgi:hypothetical protein